MDDIAFELSEDGSCKVVCREKEEKKHEVRVKEQALLITSAAKENWLNFDFFGFQGPSVTVYLPEQTYRALTIDAGTGNVKVPAELTFDTIHISISTGEIDCCASAEQTVELKATTGDIRAKYLSPTQELVMWMCLQPQKEANAKSAPVQAISVSGFRIK